MHARRPHDPRRLALLYFRVFGTWLVVSHPRPALPSGGSDVEAWVKRSHIFIVRMPSRGQSDPPVPLPLRSRSGRPPSSQPVTGLLACARPPPSLRQLPLPQWLAPSSSEPYRSERLPRLFL